MHEDEEAMETDPSNLSIAWMLGANQGNKMLRAQRELLQKYKLALADAICRPMGVVPDSAVGLLNNADLEAAKQRRVAAKEIREALSQKGCDEAL